MVAIHDVDDEHVRPLVPLVSRSRALLAFHGRHRYYPEGDVDKVRFIQNPNVPGSMLEARIPELESDDTPVLVNRRNVREAYTRAWIDDDKEIDVRDATVLTFATSISCGFAENVSVDELPSFPGARDCGGAYEMCSFYPGTTEINHGGNASITRIPACMSKYTNLEKLWLNNTPVSRIENLEKNVNLKELVLSDTKVSRIKNLDKNTKLEKLYLDGTWVSRIENIDNNTNLSEFHVSATPVSRIENIDNLVNLKQLWLAGTKVSRIENLDNNKELEYLGLGDTMVSRIENLDNNKELGEIWLAGTKVSKEEKLAFEASRPGLTVS